MKMESLLSLRDAVRLLGVTNDVARPQANVDCPVCHGKKKLNLAFDKGTDGLGLFRCAKCGVSGRSLHLWALYNGLPLDDLKGAARHYHQFIGDTYGRRNVNREKITLPVKAKKVLRVMSSEDNRVTLADGELTVELKAPFEAVAVHLA